MQATRDDREVKTQAEEEDEDDDFEEIDKLQRPRGGRDAARRKSVHLDHQVFLATVRKELQDRQRGDDSAKHHGDVRCYSCEEPEQCEQGTCQCTKKCGGACGEFKPTSAYGTNKRKGDGLHTSCKKCRNAQQREYRKRKRKRKRSPTEEEKRLRSSKQYHHGVGSYEGPFTEACRRGECRCRKRCSGACGQYLAVDRFGAHKKSKDKLGYVCKQCHILRARRRYGTPFGIVELMANNMVAHTTTRNERRQEKKKTLHKVYKPRQLQWRLLKALEAAMAEDENGRDRRVIRCFISGNIVDVSREARARHRFLSPERLEEEDGYDDGNVVVVCVCFNTGHAQWTKAKYGLAVEAYVEHKKKRHSAAAGGDGSGSGAAGADTVPFPDPVPRTTNGKKTVIAHMINSAWSRDRKLREKGRTFRSAAPDLAIGWVRSQWERQGGRSHWLGVPLSLDMSSKNAKWKASIERLDDSETYTRHNCVLVCREMQKAGVGDPDDDCHWQWTHAKVDEMFSPSNHTRHHQQQQ